MEDLQTVLIQSTMKYPFRANSIAWINSEWYQIKKLWPTQSGYIYEAKKLVTE